MLIYIVKKIHIIQKVHIATTAETINVSKQKGIV